MDNSLAVIDLFAGAGGATCGLRAAGFQVIYAVENDSEAAESYRLNHPGVDIAVADIRDISPESILRKLGLAPGDVALLKACPPCQGFSTLGKGDSSDERNDLIAEVSSWIRSFRPRSFVLENVPGLRADERLERFTRSARNLGYGVRHYVVDATSFGVPQRRRRLIVVGIYGVSRKSFPTKLEDLTPDGFGSPWATAGEVLAHAAGSKFASDALNRSRNHSSEVRERIRAIPRGGSRADLPPRLRLRCHSALERSAATSVYGRIREHDPAPTMTTRCTTPACGRFVHPLEDRGLTLREAALIQTFPDDYRFSGTYDRIERQIGNAVPVKLAEGVGIALRQLLDLAA